MDNHSLNEREELILRAVVHLYIVSAEPVGSRAVVKRFGLDISPATVRNVMADLEELEYLQQLHTSSGRVPTDKGYRYYVDFLMNVQEITRAERNRIELELSEQLNDADQIMRQASHLLALMTHQTGIVEAPHPHRAEVRCIELMPLGNKRAALLLADNYGRVQTAVASLPEHFGAEDAESLSRFLNEMLLGTPLDKLDTTLRAKLKEYIADQHRLAERAMELLDAVQLAPSEKLFLEGASQLFEQPEFKDATKAKEVFGLLEERDRVMELLRAGITTRGHPRSRVVIGSEAAEHGTENISVVSAPYSIGDEAVGMLGVLGPRRMPYSQLTTVVEQTADMLSRILTRLSGQEPPDAPR